MKRFLFTMLAVMVAVAFGAFLFMPCDLPAGTITLIRSNSVTGETSTNTYTVADTEVGIYPNGVGHTIGQANNHISFFGVTPVARQGVPAAMVAGDAQAVAVALTLGTDGFTNAAGAYGRCITSCTVNAVYAFTNSAAAVNFVTAINTQRTAAVNLGLVH